MLNNYLLNTKVTLERPNVTLDESSGAKRETWNPVSGSTLIPASVQPVNSQVRHALASRQITITHRIYTYQNLNPKRGDRILTTEGTYFLITGFFNQAGRNSVYMIEAREVTA
jgi:hypothetical protein